MTRIDTSRSSTRSCPRLRRTGRRPVAGPVGLQQVPVLGLARISSSKRVGEVLGDPADVVAEPAGARDG